MQHPNIVVIAWPNGAGKSTAASSLLRDLFAVKEFVNADVIARGLSGFEPEASAIGAGRIMLARSHACTSSFPNVSMSPSRRRWRAAASHRGFAHCAKMAIGSG